MRTSPVLKTLLAVWIVAGSAVAAIGAETTASLLERQAIALREQDIAISLEKLDRVPEAIGHYRSAIAFDAGLRAAWGNLAVHALQDGAPDQALHLASVAQFLDPYYETARGVLEDALGALPPPVKRRGVKREPCRTSPRGMGATQQPAAGGPAEPGHAPAANAKEQNAGGPAEPGHAPVANAKEQNACGWDETEGLRPCLEREAGWLGGVGAEVAGPLGELGRIDLQHGRPESAALLLGIARTVGEIDVAMLAEALGRSGDPCAAAALPGAPVSYAEHCESMGKDRSRAENLLGVDWLSLDEAARTAGRRRLDTFLGSGMDAASAARHWKMERRRGGRPLIDLRSISVRLGDEWQEDSVSGGPEARVLRRRPGDSVFVVLLLETGSVKAEEALWRLLSPRKPGPLIWSKAALVGTDPVSSRRAPLSLETNAGGRAEGTVWLAESPAAPGRALVVAAFPGTLGLGTEGLDQTRMEILDAVDGAVLVPSRWSSLPAAGGGGDDLPLPLVRDIAADERESPWRIVPMSGIGLSIAFPPGIVAAPPSAAPPRSAPARPGAVLWFRGRFVDRDGVQVEIGDETIAASVDILAGKSPGELKAFVSGEGRLFPPPAADTAATPISSIDATSILGADTGATQVALLRFKPSGGRSFEWIVARLLYVDTMAEIAIPSAAGARSVALYWIPSTVRTARGQPPPPPIDLTGRLGIAFLRPPPAERRDAFYKEGDLRSRAFTMVVPRGFYVSLNTAALDGFPARMTFRDGGAIVELDRLDPMPASEPRLRSPDAPSPAASDPASDPRIAAAIKEWLGREGFSVAGEIVRVDYARAGKLGAVRGIEAAFIGAEGTHRELRAAAPVGAEEGPSTDAGSRAAQGGGAEATKGSGRAWLLEGRDGRTYVLMSLCWGADERRRQDDVRLMLGSLRLTARQP